MIQVGNNPILECSSKGDKRFSAFFARIKKYGNTIENLYQAHKIFEDGHGGLISNLGWREAKGKKAVNQEECRKYYSELWDLYFEENPILYRVISNYKGFSDIFGKEGSVCQAIEIYRIHQKYMAVLNNIHNLVNPLFPTPKEKLK